MWPAARIAGEFVIRYLAAWLALLGLYAAPGYIGRWLGYDKARIDAWIDGYVTWLGFLPVVPLALIIGTGITMQLVLRDRRQARDNFLAVSKEARLHRAHHRFYHLWLLWQVYRPDVKSERRQQWDRQVQVALAECCNDNCGGIYLGDTGRGRDPTRPLSDERYEDALRHVEKLLREDFGPYLR